MKSGPHRVSRLLTGVSLVACLSATCLPQVVVAAAQQAPAANAAPAPIVRPLTEADAAAKEEYAYSVAVQAFIFALPLRVLERERKIRMETTAPSPDEPVAPINQLAHMRKLASAKGRLAYSPNNDTAYSTGLLELKDGPLVLHLPDIEDRFFVLTISNAYMDNLPNLAGTRGTGGKGGNILFVGPNWKGAVPKGMKVSRMPSNSGVFIVRTRVDGDNDLAALAKIQDKMSLTALSDWDDSKGAGLKPAPAPKLMARPDYKGDFAYFRTAADLMAENPPTADHADTLAQFKEIGLEVGKPFDPAALDEPTRRGVLRAEKVGMKILQWRTHARGIDLPNGWGTLLNGGHFGHDYIDRAELALSGGWINDKEDAIYFLTYLDGAGKQLQGGKKYKIHFDKLPPFNKLGFWSLTLYQGEKFQFFDNPLNRYSLGSRTKGLKFNADGSLDVYVQPQSPGPDKESNWLPSPQEGSIRMNIRDYYPKEQFLKVEEMSKYLPPIVPVAE